VNRISDLDIIPLTTAAASACLQFFLLYGICNVYGGLCFILKLLRGAKGMKYLKAKNILPDEIISLIQQYVDGEFIYIPRKNGEQRGWGEKSGSRNLLKERNTEILHKYMSGCTVDEICCSYYLSEQSVRRIIRQGRSA
jgi:hypothetical protein